MSNNEVAHLVYLQVKKTRNLLLNTPYRVAREAAAAATAAESELVDQVDHCQKDDLSSSAVKMRDFTPMGYRSFLKRLPPPKRQKNNAYLDENFDVTIGATKESHSERPLVVSLQRPIPQSPKRPILSRTKLRRSQLLSATASTSDDIVNLREPSDTVEKRLSVSELTKNFKKSLTRSESALTPKQFVLPTICDKSEVVRHKQQHNQHRHRPPKWVTKVEIRKKDDTS